MTETTATGFTQEAFEAFLAARRSRLGSRICGGSLEGVPERRAACSAAGTSKKNGCGPTSAASTWRFRFRACRRRRQLAQPYAGLSMPPAPCSLLLPAAPLLTAGVDLAGTTSAMDSQPGHSGWTRSGRARRALRQPRRLVRQHGDGSALLVHPCDRSAYDKFAALHAACWSGGTVLYVPRGVVIDRPLHMLSALSAGGTDLGHTLVVLEEGAEATLLAETASSDATAAGLHCGAIELLVGPGARLRYVNLQNWGTASGISPINGAWSIATRRLQWTIGALGSRLAKVNQHVALVGAGAAAQVNGVMFTEGKQHLSYHTLQHHQAPHCRATCSTRAACRTSRAWSGGA